MIDPIHLLTYVIRPTLQTINLWSQDAERLVLGTACAESDCGRWLRQKIGPALGIYQLEPATHEDIWVNFLAHRESLKNRITGLLAPGMTPLQQVVGNLPYATAMCRVHYLRDPNPIPTTLGDQALYWKKIYNTEQGAGTIVGYVKKWDQFVPAGMI